MKEDRKKERENEDRREEREEEERRRQEEDRREEIVTISKMLNVLLFNQSRSSLASFVNIIPCS